MGYEPKPCPFCGGEASMITARQNYGFIGIMPIAITVGGFHYLLEVPHGE